MLEHLADKAYNLLPLLFNTGNPATAPGAAGPPPGTLPVMSAGELLSARRAGVDRVEALAGTTQPHFERYYLGMLSRFAEWSQQLPASAARRHAYAGGRWTMA